MAAEIRFLGEEYEGAVEQLGGFADTLNTLVIDHGVEEFGKETMKDPTDIEVTPIVIDEEPRFIVRAWHVANRGTDDEEMQQIQDLSFRVVLMGDEAAIEDEAEKSYAITTRETLLLQKLVGIAFSRSISSSEDPRSGEE